MAGDKQVIRTSQMKLIAEHFDGFTALLMGWKAVIHDQTARVEARWFDPAAKSSACFKIDFPDIDLAEIALRLAELRPRYDGHVDDFPHHILTFEDGGDRIEVTVNAGIEWPVELQPDIDAFYAIWRPIAKRIESHDAIPKRR